jgi:hypothetical protein
MRTQAAVHEAMQFQLIFFVLVDGWCGEKFGAESRGVSRHGPISPQHGKARAFSGERPART